MGRWCSMAKRETQKEKIERLENEIEQLRVALQSSYDREMEKEEEIRGLLRNSEENFKQTSSYLQMQRDLRTLEVSVSLKEKKVKKLEKDLGVLQEKLYQVEDAYRAIVQEKQELETLHQEVLQEKQELLHTYLELMVEVDAMRPVHNARGAGRKSTLSQEEIQKILELREEGYSYKKIGNRMGLSATGIAKIIKREHKKEAEV